MINSARKYFRPFLILILVAVSLLFLFCDPLVKDIDSQAHTLTPVVDLSVGNTITVFMMAFLVSFCICHFLVRYAHLHEHLTGDFFSEKIQAMHLEPIPRIGGIAIFLAALAGLTLSGLIEETQSHKNFLFLALMVSSIPAFCGGLIEDIFKNVGVEQRLLLTMISAVMAACIVAKMFVVYRVDVVWIDKLISIQVISLLFTLFIVGGLTNAINLIDGFNGLAGGVIVVALTAISIAAFQVNDAMIAFLSIIMMGAVLGFLAWNWPRGKIFLGDGGSYFMGFLSAELCLLFLHQNPTVSPWFPLAIFIYPVIETLFTMFRRTFIHKTSNTAPDASHLHQLIFKFLLHKEQATLCMNQAKNIDSHGTTSKLNNTCPTNMRIRNNRVAPYIVTATAINAALALIYMHSTIALMGLCLAFCVFYVLSYFFLAAHASRINH